MEPFDAAVARPARPYWIAVGVSACILTAIWVPVLGRVNILSLLLPLLAVGTVRARQLCGDVNAAAEHQRQFATLRLQVAVVPNTGFPFIWKLSPHVLVIEHGNLILVGPEHRRQWDVRSVDVETKLSWFRAGAVINTPDGPVRLIAVSRVDPSMWAPTRKLHACLRDLIAASTANRASPSPSGHMPPPTPFQPPAPPMLSAPAAPPSPPTSPTSVPAGWYQDPSGPGLRWFDGTGWTRATQP
jgi:hypothetical protein